MIGCRLESQYSGVKHIYLWRILAPSNVSKCISLESVTPATAPCAMRDPSVYQVIHALPTHPAASSYFKVVQYISSILFRDTSPFSSAINPKFTNYSLAAIKALKFNQMNFKLVQEGLNKYNTLGSAN